MVNNVNAVFYATTYHPIQAGSIDGTDITAHDNGVYRALLGSATGLYDPLGDPKAEGDPYCSLFVGRLSDRTDEKSLHEAMSKFGRVKNLRLVRHIVTGASCGYAFVEFETEKDMRHAYEGAHLFKLDGASILVDYNRQQLMAGWIPRRLGGGLGGKKESGQLRFGGRDRPFRAPLRPIPHEELQKLGIPLPPEGRYMSRFQVPPPPQRKHSAIDGRPNIRESKDYQSHSVEEDDSSVKEKTSFEAQAGEGRERDRHRRRRDEFRDQETESRSYHRGQESRSESRYEGYEFEPKRQASRDGQDDHGGERVERKRRKERSSIARHEYEDEDRRRWQPQDDPEQSHGSRDADAHDRHRYQSEHRPSSRESERKHRHGDSKHRRREEDEYNKPHRSSRKHKHHRERSAGENPDIEEKEMKRSKHRERDI